MNEPNDMANLDKELIVRYQEGDVDALEQMVEKYRRPLFAFILNMTGGRGDADEVFQEVWFRAIKNLGKYRQKNFFGWLVRIARNFIIDRARRRHPDFSLDDERGQGVPWDEVVAGNDPSPEKQMESQDVSATIARAITTLPVEQKEVFIMRVQADLSFKEIAKIQKVSINTALARMQYALTKLRPILKEYEAK